MRSMKTFALIVAAVSLSACGDVRSSTAPTPPPVVVSTAPAAIRVLASSRSDQQIDVTATVLTSDGHVVPSVVVTFTVGAGTIAPASVTTDANGTAHTLAVTPSSTTIQATAGDLHASVTVAASAPPSPPEQPPTFPPPVPTPPPPPPVVIPPTSLSAVVNCTPAAHGSATSCNITAAFGSTLPSAAITNVDWDWGDGHADSTAIPVDSRIYVNAGSYTVFATVTATVPTTPPGPQTVTVSKVIVVP